MRRIAILARVCTAAPLLLAACVDDPTRPATRFANADSQASLTPAAPLSFRQVSAGGSYTCGVTTSNVTYCWGNNFYGQLGNGTRDDRLRPVPVVSP